MDSTKFLSLSKPSSNSASLAAVNTHLKNPGLSFLMLMLGVNSNPYSFINIR